MKKLLLTAAALLVLAGIVIGADHFATDLRSLQYPALRSVALNITGARDTVLKAADETLASVQNTAAKDKEIRARREAVAAAVAVWAIASPQAQAVAKAYNCANGDAETFERLDATEKKKVVMIADMLFNDKWSEAEDKEVTAAFCKAVAR